MFQVAKLGLFWLQKLSQSLELINQSCDTLRPSQANQRWDGGKSRTFWMGLKTKWSHPLCPQIRGVWQDWDSIPLSFTTYPIALLPTSSECVVSIPYPKIKQPQAQKSSQIKVLNIWRPFVAVSSTLNVDNTNEGRARRFIMIKKF